MISYGDFEYDGRLRELYKACCLLGNVFLFSRGKVPISSNHFLINESYTKFIRTCVSIGKRIDSVGLLFLDNRKSVIPGLRLKKRFKSAKIVLDCRELYLARYVKHLSGKIGCFVEKRGIKKANVIICANEERAIFMQDYYKLASRPLIYENFRKLEYSSPQKKEKSLERFQQYGVDGEIRIVATSGCDLSRLTDVLVSNLPKVNYPCKLFLVGDSPKNDLIRIEKICSLNNIKNVVHVGKLCQDDLKALLSYCHIGIVNYNQFDINNKYCASGKIFEFVYEGLPVVTTTNPPLVSFCSKYSVGVCDDEFYKGINNVASNYDFYKNNTHSFLKSISVDENNSNLACAIKQRI